MYYRNFKIKDVQIITSRENWDYDFKVTVIHLPTITRVEAIGKPLEDVREKALKSLDALLDSRSES